MSYESNEKDILSHGGVNVLSLFDGMACAMLALIEAGINVNRYVAYEIDKYAVKTTSHNFPFIEHMGDVFEADFSQYKGFDLLMGGSPCTYWSVCKSTGRETEASGMGWELFCQYVKALHDAKPSYFIYENNKSMSSAIRGSISQTFGFEPICINSSLVSAQHRQRLYWVGKRNEDGTYGKVDVGLPDDRGILLQNVLDSTSMATKSINVVDGDKSFALKANYYKSAFANFVNGGGHYPATGVAESIESTPVDELKEIGINLTSDGKAQCLRATCYKDGIRNIVGNNIDRKTGVAEPIRIGTWPNNAKNQAHDSQQYRIYDIAAKCNTLCGNGGGMGAKTGLYAMPVEYYNNIPIKAISGADGKTYTVYEVKNGVIIINDKQYPIKLEDGYYIIRKLTVSECKRLQTVPEWYEFPVSDTQALKMLGNGWTVSVIAHLLNSTKNTQQNKI